METWAVAKETHGYYIGPQKHGGGVSPVAVARGKDVIEEERNADLLAVLPEALATLEVVHGLRIAWPKEVEAQVRSVLAKAKGAGS